MLNGFLALLQVSPEFAQTMRWIAIAQITMAAVMVMFVLLAIGGALQSLSTIRRFGRLIKELEVIMNRLVPRAEPLIDGLTKAATDVSEVTGAMKRDVEGVRLTVAEGNIMLRHLLQDAEVRVRRFGEVVDMVQSEAEGMLLDVASTARGVQTAAGRLREDEVPARRRETYRHLTALEDDEL